MAEDEELYQSEGVTPAESFYKNKCSLPYSRTMTGTLVVGIYNKIVDTIHKKNLKLPEEVYV